MDLKIGRKYMASLCGTERGNPVVVLGNIQECDDGMNRDKVLVRDLNGCFTDEPEDGLDGSGASFLYNLSDWTFTEVPLSKLLEEYLKESLQVLGEEVVEELWNKEDIKEFLQKDSGSFLVTGLMIGHGHSREEINETFEDQEALIALVDTFTF